MLDKESLNILREALEKLDAGFSALPEFDARIPGVQRIAETLAATAERLQDNFPYFHPLYAGQMLKPPHPIARVAYAMAMWLNPNNHALDGGKASSHGLTPITSSCSDDPVPATMYLTPPPPMPSGR